MPNEPTHAVIETSQQYFERALSGEPFKGLKAILDILSPDREALAQGVNETNTYEDLLARLGYQITLVPQIHVKDAYTRVGAAGGIKAVLPYHDIPTQSSLPTLVNLNSTVTTTLKAASFFNQRLVALKALLSPSNPKSL